MKHSATNEQEIGGGHRVFFYAGPLLIISSAVLLFNGYKAVWLNMQPNAPTAIVNMESIATVIAVLGLARFVERLIEGGFKGIGIFKQIITIIFSLSLLCLSSMGVTNALYYWTSGRSLLEDGAAHLMQHYEDFSKETHRLTATPSYDRLSNEIAGPLQTLKSEIQSKNCGIGPGARDALATIRAVIGPTFVPLNFNRVPKCDDARSLGQMADQYETYIRAELFSIPLVVDEYSAIKIKLRRDAEERHDAFRKKYAALVASISDAAGSIQFFGSRDGFNVAIHNIVAMNAALKNDLSIASETLRKTGVDYPKNLFETPDIEQQETLGNITSLRIAVTSLNPWYIILFLLASILLDFILVGWFYHVRNNVFSESVIYSRIDQERVRYLWRPLKRPR